MNYSLSSVFAPMIVMLALLTNSGSIFITPPFAHTSLGYIMFGLVCALAYRNAIRYPIGWLWATPFIAIALIFRGEQFIFLLAPMVAILLFNLHKPSTACSYDSHLLYFLLFSFFVLYLFGEMPNHGYSLGSIREGYLLDPNFFAAFFVGFYYPLILGTKRIRLIAAAFLAFVVFVTLSRALLIALVFLSLMSILYKKTESFYLRIAMVVIVAISATYPFMIPDSLFLGMSSYTEGADRLVQLTDASNYGRKTEIILAANAVFTYDLYLSGVPEESLVRKPHNWFWLISLRFGLINAVLFAAGIIYLVARLPFKFSIIITATVMQAGFLDFQPIGVSMYIGTALLYWGNAQMPNIQKFMKKREMVLRR